MGDNAVTIAAIISCSAMAITLTVTNYLSGRDRRRAAEESKERTQRRADETVTAKAAETAPADDAPLPVDLQNPPRPMRYTGLPGKHVCHCHGWPIEPGDEILWWPLSEGRVVVFCEAGVKGQ